MWNELLSRARADKDLQVTELDYRQSLSPRFMERYRIPDYKAETPSIFHSSYFRILPQAGVYNVTTVHDLTYHFYRHGLAKAVHLWEERRALLDKIVDDRVGELLEACDDAFYEYPDDLEALNVAYVRKNAEHFDLMI